MKSNKYYFGKAYSLDEINVYKRIKNRYKYLFSYICRNKQRYIYKHFIRYEDTVEKGKLTKLTKAIYDIPDFE